MCITTVGVWLLALLLHIYVYGDKFTDVCVIIHFLYSR